MTLHHGWFFPFDGWLSLALLVLLTIVVVWLFVSALSRRDRRPTDEAEAILRARLARGEISPEEYEQTRRVLGLK